MEPDNYPVTGTEVTRMRPRHPGSFREQVNFLRRQFLQDGDLPFTDVLTEEVIAQALAAVTGWLDRVFSPLVTLWVFLGQVLSADHSCRAAVARLIAHRLAQGQRPCSAATGAYCQARKRLPESFFADVARQTGRALEADVDPRWLWKGRHVYLFDGTTVTMPDTRENQRAYPQVYNRSRAWAFRSRDWGPSSPWLVGPLWTSGSARTPGRGKARSAYSAGCGTACAPGTSS
jgi:hypothetical protein